MELGLRRLRWTPQTFWAASPRELAVAAGLAGARGAATRADLDRLIAACPDDVPR